MTPQSQPTWQDAVKAAARLRPFERELLLLTARLPLLWTEVAAKLCGLRSRAQVTRTFERLTADGLVAAVSPSFRPTRAPWLRYLTDLGIATVAYDQGVDPVHLARVLRLRRRDLLAALAGLPHLAACYELLGFLAASARQGFPQWLAWERPWRRAASLAGSIGTVSARLPAAVTLSGEGLRAVTYLLLPDLGAVPLRAYRPVLLRLLRLRKAARAPLPPLVVAAGDGARVDGWRQLLAVVAAQQREEALVVTLLSWTQVRGPAQAGAATAAPGARRTVVLLPSGVPPLQEHPLGLRMPHLVGGPLHAKTVDGARQRATVGQAALNLTLPDRALLDLVGRQPFLTCEQVGVIMGWTARWTQQRCSALMGLGLLRQAVRPEGDARGISGLLELTAAGMALVAAQHGLTVGEAVRSLGLAGGGPATASRNRAQLVGPLEHTLGVNSIVVELARTAGRRAAAGKDDALSAWQNGAVCARGWMRPDGYGVYQQNGRRYGFFVEYDRATERGREYRRKFAAYYAYRDSGRCAQDYAGFPTILVITTEVGPEERIARAIRAVGAGRPPLPVLLTTVGLMRGAADGLLGRIWRAPWVMQRRTWLPSRDTDDRSKVLK